MNWIDVPSDIERKSINLLNNKLSLTEIIHIITVDKPTILFSKEVYNGILSHLNSNLNVELGGILTGNFFVDNNDIVKVIWIENFIESKSYDSTSVSLSMNTDIWNNVNDVTSHDNSIVIGWYHSHPNLGAFFSSTDRYTQKHFFNNEYSIGLVIDPIRNEEKYFLNDNSEEISENNVIKAEFS